jgi:DNA-binding transcriptional ArsR family regulator
MEANIAFVAGLLSDPSRAAMCLALAGGEARPAGELAARAGVSAQTASNHLAKLIAGRILRVEQQGRWRYYRLAGEDVGYAVEALAVVAPAVAASSNGYGPDPAARRLKDARTCYSHLAGRLGVALADALVREQWLEEDGRAFRVTPKGTAAFGQLGITARGARGQAPARRSRAAGSAACAVRGRCRSRRTAALSCGKSSPSTSGRRHHDHAEHPLHAGRATPG